MRRTHPPVRMLEQRLASGHMVTIEHIEDEISILLMLPPAIPRQRRIPVRSFPLFGRPLSERIRRTIIELQNMDEQTQDARDAEHGIANAVRKAVYEGGPTEEQAYGWRREPPLIHRDLPSHTTSIAVERSRHQDPRR